VGRLLIEVIMLRDENIRCQLLECDELAHKHVRFDIKLSEVERGSAVLQCLSHYNLCRRHTLRALREYNYIHTHDLGECPHGCGNVDPELFEESALYRTRRPSQIL
jgi:hypothetical protein